MKEGLDMKLIEYTAVCTSHKKGVLEFIGGAENLAGLIKNYRAYAWVGLIVATGLLFSSFHSLPHMCQEDDFNEWLMMKI